MKLLSENTKAKRIDQLRELRDILADEIDQRPGARDLAALVKQYRETLAEIDLLGGAEEQDDEITEILTKRKASGKSKAVRSNRSQA